MIAPRKDAVVSAKRNRSRTVPVAVLSVAVVLGVCIFWLRSPPEDQAVDVKSVRNAPIASESDAGSPVADRNDNASDASSPVADRNDNASVTAKSAKRVRRMVARAVAPMSNADRKLYDAVQSALDDEDFAAVRAAAAAAYRSANAEVRQQAVDALGWFGEKALPELTPMMADADSGVAQSACDAWESGLSEMESAFDRVKVAQMALMVISDPDALTMIGSQFSNAATELIDGADDAAADEYRVQVLRGIVDIMGDESNLERAKAAREIYESVTSHEWISVGEAEKYLADPSNYEPPESDE